MLNDYPAHVRRVWNESIGTSFYASLHARAQVTDSIITLFPPKCGHMLTIIGQKRYEWLHPLALHQACKLNTPSLDKILFFYSKFWRWPVKMAETSADWLNLVNDKTTFYHWEVLHSCNILLLLEKILWELIHQVIMHEPAINLRKKTSIRLGAMVALWHCRILIGFPRGNLALLQYNTWFCLLYLPYLRMAWEIH